MEPPLSRFGPLPGDGVSVNGTAVVQVHDSLSIYSGQARWPSIQTRAKARKRKSFNQPTGWFFFGDSKDPIGSIGRVPPGSGDAAC